MSDRQKLHDLARLKGGVRLVAIIHALYVGSPGIEEFHSGILHCHFSDHVIAFSHGHGCIAGEFLAAVLVAGFPC